MLERVLSWQAPFVGFAAVVGAAAIAMKVLSDDPPRPTREELEVKYGRWAVETALAIVPRGDVEKLEREAKRLYEARLARGF